MTIFKWEKGRQNSSGYKKFTLLYIKFPLKIDSYILKFPINSYIQPHKDIVSQNKHYRINIILKKPKKGGNFIAEKTLFSLGRVHFFRPDLYTHSVSKIEQGERIVFSLGFAI